MLIVFGKPITSDKKIRFALKKIFGIGISRAHFLCNKLNIPLNMKTSELSEKQKKDISEYINLNFILDSNLKIQIKSNIDRFIDLNCIRGFRHRLKLPVRGQRTHSNGRTRKKGIF